VFRLWRRREPAAGCRARRRRPSRGALFEEIDVAVFRYSIEEASCLHRAPTAEGCISDSCRRGGSDLGKIEDDAAQVRVLFEQANDQGAVAPAYVDDGLDLMPRKALEGSESCLCARLHRPLGRLAALLTMNVRRGPTPADRA
jgi:hypothetical protein